MTDLNYIHNKCCKVVYFTITHDDKKNERNLRYAECNNVMTNVKIENTSELSYVPLRSKL